VNGEGGKDNSTFGNGTDDDGKINSVVDGSVGGNSTTNETNETK
jgi:hypothetical protein